MPVYEFKCQDCGHRFSKLYRQMTSREDSPLPPCPQCDGANTQRAVASFAVHGQPGIDHEEIAHHNAQAERESRFTPKAQIDKWKAAKKPSP